MVRRGSGHRQRGALLAERRDVARVRPAARQARRPRGAGGLPREKVVVVDGDITEPNLGLSEETAEKVAKDIDVLINSSGRVTFNPPLESAMRTNVEGTKNVIAFAKRMKRPALIHTSTCFVAGNRSGEVWEDEELDGYFPRHKELPGTQFSVEQEIADSAAGAARIRQLADDAQVLAELRQEARERLREENRDPDDEQALKLAVARARKEWIRSRDDQAGHRAGRGLGLAQHLHVHEEHGRPAGRARDRHRARHRAARDRRERGRATRSAAGTRASRRRRRCVYLALKGQNVLPVSHKLILDVVPVDHVASGMLMVGGAGDRRAAEAGVPALQRRPRTRCTWTASSR